MAHYLFTLLSPWIEIFLFLYFSGVNLTYVILLIGAIFKVHKRTKELSVEDFSHMLGSESLPEITLLVPAYNEEILIVQVVRNLLRLSYRYKKIIVVNDGSTDTTLQLLQEAFQLIAIPMLYEEIIPSKPIRGVYRSRSNPELIVIDKENGKKHDALNAGLNLCKTPYFITVDADTFVDDAGFDAMIRPLLSDDTIVAVGAAVRISNGCELDYNRIIPTAAFPENYISAFQALEYHRTFIMRLGWDYVGGNFGMSGAFSIFKTKWIVAIKGFAHTFSNDLEIILRLHRVLIAANIPYKIIHFPDPVAWTNGPLTVKELDRQRTLWQRGICDSVWFHKSLFMNPRFGWFGLFVFPFLVLGEALEHLVEFLAIIYAIVGIYLGVVDTYKLILLLALIWGFTIIYTLCCLVVEEFTFRRYKSLKTVARLILSACLEIFGYRQLSLISRDKGTRDFIIDFGEIRGFSKEVNEKVKQAIKELKTKNGKNET